MAFVAALLGTLVIAAHAGVVSAVPPGVTTVTVLVCEAPGGCPAELRAMASYLDSLGLPLLDFDTVVEDGPGGGDARVAYDRAMAVATRSPTLANVLEAREAMAALRVTLPRDPPFRLWLELGAAQLYAGDASAADESFTAAASCSDGRVINLPPLSEDALSRYLYIASAHRQTRLIEVQSDAPGQVFVDGERVGNTPYRGEVRVGWHRITVERPGRRTAWVAETADATSLRARIAGDDSEGFLATALEGAVRGVAPPADAGASLATWASAQGLRWVRFVTLAPVGDSDHTGIPEEEIEDAEHTRWKVYATWLDVGTGRFVERGPGPASLRVGGSADRLRLGVGLGYVRLQPLAEDYGPHDHVDVELNVRWRFTAGWSLDGRVGLMRSAQLYYLREGVFEHDVYPVAVGVRFGDRGRGAAGPYVGAHALVIVPLTEGGEVFGGWEIAPTWRWRVGIEARAGMTTDGIWAGGGITFARGG